MGRVVVNGDLIITDYAEADGIVANYSNYYQAYLHYLQGSMDASDTATIAALADKCPVLDAAVVYQARALRQRLSFDYRVYNDDSCEYNNGGNYRRGQNNDLDWGNDTVAAYSLYPNPNNGSFVLKQSIVENKVVNLKVYNALGLLVYQSAAIFANGQTSVQLGTKAQGVYLVCIGDNKERVICLRFMIN